MGTDSVWSGAFTRLIVDREEYQRASSTCHTPASLQSHTTCLKERHPSAVAVAECSDESVYGQQHMARDSGS
jgi:hypothetical protein